MFSMRRGRSVIVASFFCPKSSSSASSSISSLIVGSELHLEDVEASDDPVHRVDDAPLVDVDVVDLDRLGGRLLRRRREEPRDFFRLERIADVEGAQAPVEKRARAEDDTAEI